MKEEITLEMIIKCQEILKTGEYDLDKFVVEVAPQAPCSVVQGLFPEILDMALQHLKLKASHSLLEYEISPEPKTCIIDIIFDDNHKMIRKLKNNLLPIYDWRLTH